MQSGSASVAWDQDDDWAGLRDPSERRKRQNRLNQRLFRKRKHLQRYGLFQSGCQRQIKRTEGVDINDETHDATHDQPALRGTPDHVSSELILIPSRAQLVKSEFKERIFLNRSIKLRSPTNLANLTLLNVINGLATNAVALSIPFIDLERDESISQFNFEGPISQNRRAQLSTAPYSLHPTELQRTIIHHPWVDVLPIAGVRDNILRCICAAQAEEDEMCSAIFGVEIGEDMVPPISLWGDPSNPRSWEFSPAFLMKWKCLVQGCPEVFESTNFWRRIRGRREIPFRS